VNDGIGDLAKDGVGSFGLLSDVLVHSWSFRWIFLVMLARLSTVGEMYDYSEHCNTWGVRAYGRSFWKVLQQFIAGSGQLSRLHTCRATALRGGR
jgi:hypothetical protein